VIVFGERCELLCVVWPGGVYIVNELPYMLFNI